MRRLESVYPPGAPADFRERIDYWWASHGLPKEMHDGMHRLRNPTLFKLPLSSLNVPLTSLKDLRDVWSH